jgi:hypothetical protein
MTQDLNHGLKLDNPEAPAMKREAEEESGKSTTRWSR